MRLKITETVRCCVMYTTTVHSDMQTRIICIYIWLYELFNSAADCWFTLLWTPAPRKWASMLYGRPCYILPMFFF